MPSAALSAGGGPKKGTYQCYAYGATGLYYTGLTVIIKSKTKYQEKGYKTVGRYHYAGGPKHKVVFDTGKLKGHAAGWDGKYLYVVVVKGENGATCYPKM